MKKWHKAKVTVLKNTLNQEIVDEYLADEDRAKGYGACTTVKEGQEFIVEDPGIMPEGFCAWAWADINRDVAAMMAGGEFPWIKQMGVTIASCTDGLRPVIFKIERI